MSSHPKAARGSSRSEEYKKRIERALVRPEVLDAGIIRMIGDDPGLKRIQRGTGRRLSYSHCLTGFRISREQGRHEPVDQLDKWIKD